MNLFLVRWLMRKHKRLAGHKTRAAEALGGWRRPPGASCIGKRDLSPRLDDGSRMSREVHVRFCEGPGVKCPGLLTRACIVRGASV